MPMHGGQRLKDDLALVRDSQTVPFA
jgi:hypothetical protein